MRKQLYGILGIAGIVLILIVLFAIHYLTTGRIVVTTASNDNYISIFKVGNSGSQQTIVDNAQHKAAKSLPAGTYIIRVNSKSVAMSKLVQLTAHKTFTYDLNPASTTALEPITSADIRNIAASDSSLVYVKLKDGIIYKVDAQNNIQVIDSTHDFTTVKWADPSYGVGSAGDGSLYIIDGTTVTPLSVPFSTTDKKPILFDISKNRHIFITHGLDTYSGTSADGFTKIYTAKLPIASVVPLGGAVAVQESPGEAANASPYVTILDTSGHMRAQKSFDVDTATGSPDGKYLALGSSSGGQLVDGLLNTITRLPTTKINAFSWSGDTLYYSSNEQLWSYSVSSQTANLIANARPGDILYSLTTSTDNAYVYMVVSGSNDSQPYRVGLHGQKATDYVYQLPVILPNNSAYCPLDYINFTQPTILAYDVVDPDPAQACADSVNTTFTPYNIAPSSLQIHYLTELVQNFPQS